MYRLNTFEQDVCHYMASSCPELSFLCKAGCRPWNSLTAWAAPESECTSCLWRSFSTESSAGRMRFTFAIWYDLGLLLAHLEALGRSSHVTYLLWSHTASSQNRWNNFHILWFLHTKWWLIYHPPKELEEALEMVDTLWAQACSLHPC